MAFRIGAIGGPKLRRVEKAMRERVARAIIIFPSRRTARRSAREDIQTERHPWRN
jgi:hypothetical protein